jgi:multisubunit Na+/H+ antiporter MnhC subunit
MMGRLTSIFGIALLLGAAGAAALATHNLLTAVRGVGDAEDRLVAAYNAPGILTNIVIAFAMLVLGVGLLRSAQQNYVSRLVIGAIGLIVLVVMAHRAGWL